MRKSAWHFTSVCAVTLCSSFVLRGILRLDPFFNNILKVPSGPTSTSNLQKYIDPHFSNVSQKRKSLASSALSFFHVVTKVLKHIMQVLHDAFRTHTQYAPVGL